MSKDKLTDYDSSTASNNTDVGGISVAEGMLPSAVNNSLRELTKQLGAFADGTDGIDVLSLADDDASHAIKLQAPSAVTADTTFTFPDGDGTADQVLKTDGSGQLGWVAQTAVASNPSLIINGGMTVSQRGTSFANPSDDNYTLDRIHVFNSNDGAATITQATIVPNDEVFYKSIKFDCTTLDGTIAAGQYLSFNQRIEGLNNAVLGFGESDAKSITVSFYAKSNLTGTFCYAVRNSATDRAYIKEFSLASANTWERISFTIPGDTSGTWLTTNGIGAIHGISLSMGSTYHGTANQWNTSNVVATSNQVNFLSSTDNEFFLTGWKVEIGSAATPFEHRSYGDELARCQRYFTTWNAGWSGVSEGAGYQQTSTVSFPVQMNHTPDIARTGGTSSTRYPSSNFLAFYRNADGFTANVTAATAGGNESWQATGTADSEL